MSWLLLALTLLLVLIWILLCCNIPFRSLSILLCLQLVALLVIRSIPRIQEPGASPRFWILIALLLLLASLWIALFSSTWLYLLLMLLALMAGLFEVWLASRAHKLEEPFPSWILPVVFVVFLSVWLVFYGRFTFGLALILLLFWPTLLFLGWSIAAGGNRRASGRFWLSLVLTIALLLVWLIFFLGTWMYLAGLLWVLLSLGLVAWLVVRYRNPLWGVISIVDPENRILWSASLAGQTRLEGKSYYLWRFKPPVCTVGSLRIHAWDQRAHWLVLVATFSRRKQYFRRNLDRWQDCELSGGCRIVWQEGSAASRPGPGRSLPKPRPGRAGGKKSGARAPRTSKR